MVTKFFRLPLALGICAHVEPCSPQATRLLDLVEPHTTDCDMPDCGETAVRVGVYEVPDGGDGEPRSEFRGLCERHKQTGMWTDAGTAWGWD